MSLLTTSGAPSLLGGVSQQPDTIRLSTQGTEQTNAYPSVVDGLTKRHPLEHQALISATDLSSSRIHKVNRSASERYIFTLKADGITAWDVVANKSVTISGPQGTTPDYSYLTGATKGTIRALTVADSTFVVNTGKAVTMDPHPSAGDRFFGQAFVWVRQGAYNLDYKITVKVASQAEATYTYTVGDGTGLPATADDPVRVGTDIIASGLATAINAGTDVSATQVGSVVRIFSHYVINKLEISDGRGDTAMVRINREVDQVEDLPLTCRTDYKVKVIGSQESEADDYWVQFTADDDELFGKGFWEESIAPDIKHRISKTTMPHRLVRKQDDAFGSVTGTAFEKFFEWDAISWDEREVGDDSSNEIPSFVSTEEESRYISDVFFFNGRLGFLSDQNVILSEANGYFNFWRTTVQTLLDGDPIDVQANHTRVSILHTAVPYQDRLVLFSDRTQFVLSGGGQPLTSKTVQIIPELEFENTTSVQPEPSGPGVLFAFKRGDYSGVRELQRISDEAFDAFDITGHVPRYIKGTITSIAASTLEDIAIVLADGDTSKLWVYKWANDGQQRAQSAWSEYELGTDAVVLSADFIENVLYILVVRTGGTYLESMTISAGLVDANDTSLIYLDRRIDDTDCTIAVASGDTTITLPYSIDPLLTYSVVSRADATHFSGISYNILVKTATTIKVEGDLTGIPFWIGEAYTASYTFTPPFLRSRQDIALIEPTQDIVAGHLAFSNSEYFKVTISARGSLDHVEEHNGPYIGTGAVLLGQTADSSGVLRFPIRNQARRSTITLTNPSPLASQWISVEWEIEESSRSSGRA